ncbi:MAG: YcxB family protein [Oscillospiraceae bacterium]|nr:YcxB family protein [Oscillospiraceae bacterium]
MEENKDLLEEYEEEMEEEEVAEPLPEVLFRVKTVLDMKAQAEATKAVRGKLIELITWIFVAICGAFAVVMFWQYFTAEEPPKSNLIFGGLMLLAVLFSIYNKIFGSKRALKKWESSLQQKFGTSALHLTTEFYPRSLSQTVEETENVMVEGYSVVTNMKESESLFLLYVGARQWYFISKTGFEVGNADSFRKFISEKIGG